ncbi:MAG TPA: DUF5985 family protein [Verrucomicrobiae bacterium]|jgi:hypothetical protein
MSINLTHEFVKGAITMGYLVAAVFFFRFWRENHDRLFLFFAAAFLLMAINWPLYATFGEIHGIGFLLIRLLAYTIIIIAIVDKNLRRA